MSKKSLLIVASLAYDGIETKENKVDNIFHTVSQNDKDVSINLEEEEEDLMDSR